MRIVKSILLLLFIGAVVLFTFQNLQTVRLSFLSFHLETPLSFVSVLIYILGALSGGLLFSMLKKLLNRNAEQKNENSPE